MKAMEHMKAHPRSDEFNTLLFWHGPLSQWWYSPFEVDGTEYNCAEQYMMVTKARMFGDAKAETSILNMKGPHTSQHDFGQRYPNKQREMGRRVKNFCPIAWHAVARDVVTRGNLAKFSQNDELLACLMYTRKYTLVESSPLDQLWGTGLAEDEPGAFNPAKWHGRNWLGQVLTELRNGVIL